MLGAAAVLEVVPDLSLSMRKPVSAKYRASLSGSCALAVLLSCCAHASTEIATSTRAVNAPRAPPGLASAWFAPSEARERASRLAALSRWPGGGPIAAPVSPCQLFFGPMVRRALGASLHVECRHFALRVVARDVAKDHETAGCHAGTCPAPAMSATMSSISPALSPTAASSTTPGSVPSGRDFGSSCVLRTCDLVIQIALRR